ncbi:2105_t:CDS:2 [Dentiscutata heterogama]|uniref:2105_t:CDS:1 n=1 Tax=Dentiscutata heterogama TaxID=1316150 RepID=A0ACA9KPR7_9GLOM|nr:2105_t:CDS:2 [Dentiscutata heterogama]
MEKKNEPLKNNDDIVIDQSITNTVELNDNNNNNNFRFIDGRKFYNIKNSKYPMPNDNKEHERLNYQQAIFRRHWQGNFSSPVKQVLANSKNKAKVLDVGCGSASWIFDMANDYPDATFIGLDILPNHPELTKLSNASYVQHNILDGLPFEDNTFDFIHQRFLGSSYQKQKWMFVINELVRILKPGGYLEGELENIHHEEKNLMYGKNSGELGQMAGNAAKMFCEGLKPALAPILKISSKELDDLFESIAKEINELDCYKIFFRVYASKK